MHYLDITSLLFTEYYLEPLQIDTLWNNLLRLLLTRLVFSSLYYIFTDLGRTIDAWNSIPIVGVAPT